MKLYTVFGGPPSLSILQTFKLLNIPFEHIYVDFGKGEHMNDDFTQKNPQKEIPILDDNGFFLSESNAILQYICDKYKPDSPLYPNDPQVRAIVNHRLCFNLSTYYRYITEYSINPIYFDYQRTPLGLKKVHIALEVLNTYLTRLGKKYVAADHLTIADFPLVNATMCLEAIDFDFSAYKKVSEWYSTFKKEYPELWEITTEGLGEISSSEKNRPDLSHMDHPIHPVRK